jgi:hypothetical protein
VYYQFTVENTGDVPLTSVNVTDPAPYLNIASCGWKDGDNNPLSASFTLPVADADNGHIATCVLGPVTAVAAGAPHVNTATAHGTHSSVVYNDSSTATYAIAMPNLAILKTLTTFADPVNGTSNPMNIPGADVNYTLLVTNSGAGSVDNNMLTIVDPIPANTELFTGDLDGGAPFAFVDGVPSSGLTCTFTALGNAGDCVEFSSDGGATWAYAPNGSYDPAVTHIRFTPAGAMNADAAAGSPSPNFSLQFRVRVQ